MKAKGQRVALIFLGVLALLFAVPVVATWQVIRQERLNRALIAAVKAADDKAVMSLLQDRADANCRDEPPRKFSLWQTVIQRLKHNTPGPTALFLVVDLMPPELLKVQLLPSDVQKLLPSSLNRIELAKALLAKGANVNVTNQYGWTPLIVAAGHCDPEMVELLLAQGVNTDMVVAAGR